MRGALLYELSALSVAKCIHGGGGCSSPLLLSLLPLVGIAAEQNPAYETVRQSAAAGAGGLAAAAD
jgi:hypothetical protein